MAASRGQARIRHGHFDTGKPRKTALQAVRASRTGDLRFVKWFRRLLIEVWGIIPIAAVVGFLGPFGTYLSGDFLLRVGRWWGSLMMAYIVMRPAIELWRWIARVTRLPQGSMVFWGMVLTSFPLALGWRLAGREEVRLLGGYTGLLPFTFLCAMLTIAVVWWAERADVTLLR